MRNSLIVRHLILRVLWEISKSVCINNHIKEILTVQLTTDMWLSSIFKITIKTLTIKELRRNRQKFEIFFVKFQAPFPQKIINIHLYISYKAFIRSIV